jgi:hypothetical protein
LLPSGLTCGDWVMVVAAVVIGGFGDGGLAATKATFLVLFEGVRSRGLLCSSSSLAGETAQDGVKRTKLT